MTKITITVFEDTQLNPNEKVVNNILKALGRTEGECPCNQGDIPKEDKMCPCKKYRTTHKCCCNLYVKKDEKNNTM